MTPTRQESPHSSHQELVVLARNSVFLSVESLRGSTMYSSWYIMNKPVLALLIHDIPLRNIVEPLSQYHV